MVRALNQRLFQEAKRFLPGGVNSPVRAFQAVGGYPVFMKQARGSRIYAQDGREFIDYCLGFGAFILGHSHPAVVEALKETINNGTSFGAPTKSETELARYIARAVPSIEQLRLTNSGTEAVMVAVRLARGYTGRNKIIKFAGSYHGHADYFLDCAGIPEDFRKYTLSVPYNDIKMTRKAVKKHCGDLAAIIVEPVAANMGVVLPQEGFLEELRRLADKDNILLIFDEVITGFRLTYGGAQKIFHIQPDLTCLGKIIGGGLPIGACGGRREIMRLLAPEGEIYQAGTFSGNPVSVNAGLAALKILSGGKYYQRLERLTSQLCEKIRQIAGEFGIKIQINYTGSMFSLFFAGRQVTDYNIARTQDVGLFRRFYHGLLKEGVYFSPSGREANFISAAHTDEDIEKTVKAAQKTLSGLRRR